MNSATSTNPTEAAQQAVTYARDHLFERSAVLDRRDFWKRRSTAAWARRRMPMSGRSSTQRAARGEFRTVDHAGAGQQYTTAAMLRMEREIVARMQEGNQRGYE